MNAWGELEMQLGNRWRRWVVSLHAPAALFPGKEPSVPTEYEVGGTLNGGFGEEKNLLQLVPNTWLDNILCTTQCIHTASRTERLVTALRTVMDHSAYSSDLAPSDFHLFGSLKKHLVGKQFASDANVKKAVSSVTGTWFRFLLHRNYKPCCHGGSNSLLSMMTVWRCDVYHLLRMFRPSVLAYCFVTAL
jgi:hypothetical protein